MHHCRQHVVAGDRRLGPIVASSIAATREQPEGQRRRDQNRVSHASRSHFSWVSQAARPYVAAHVQHGDVTIAHESDRWGSGIVPCPQRVSGTDAGCSLVFDGDRALYTFARRSTLDPAIRNRTEAPPQGTRDVTTISGSSRRMSLRARMAARNTQPRPSSGSDSSRAASIRSCASRPSPRSIAGVSVRDRHPAAHICHRRGPPADSESAIKIITGGAPGNKRRLPYRSDRK